MAINRLRVRDVMVARGIAAEAPAMEFADIIDEEIESSQSKLVGQSDLDAKLDAMEARLMAFIEQKMHQQTKFFIGALIGVVGVATAIISILTTVT